MFILFSCSIYKQVISYIEEGNLIYVYMYIFVFYFTILSCYSHTIFLFLYFILQYFHFILIQYSYTGDIVYHIRKSDYMYIFYYLLSLNWSTKIWSCSLYLRLVYIHTFFSVPQFSSITIILVLRYINMILLSIFLFCLYFYFLCIYTFLYIIKSS